MSEIERNVSDTFWTRYADLAEQVASASYYSGSVCVVSLHGDLFHRTAAHRGDKRLFESFTTMSHGQQRVLTVAS